MSYIKLDLQHLGEPALGHGLLFLGTLSGALATWADASRKMEKICTNYQGLIDSTSLNKSEDIELGCVKSQNKRTCAASFNTRTDTEKAAAQCSKIWMDNFPDQKFYAIYTLHKTCFTHFLEKTPSNINIESVSTLFTKQAPFNFQGSNLYLKVLTQKLNKE